MDYDFSEYCEDHLSKTFNPFACELQPLIVSKVSRIYFLCSLSAKIAIFMYEK